MPVPQIYLISPLLSLEQDWLPSLEQACDAENIAAILLNLPSGNQHDLVNFVKRLAKPPQDKGIAILISVTDDDPVPLAIRAGLDGVHVTSDVSMHHKKLKNGLMLGAGHLKTRDEAMVAGEAGADYLMFGEPFNGVMPFQSETLERATWWAELFETPCVAYAQDLSAVPPLAQTGAEFIAVDFVWSHPQGIVEALKSVQDCLTQSVSHEHKKP